MLGFYVKVLILLSFLPRNCLCFPQECVLPFPRAYVAYHLGEGETINVNGKLDERAWDMVGWTEDFVGKVVVSECFYLKVKFLFY